MSNDECVELKNLKYKSMKLSKNPEEKKETVENMNNLDDFLHNEQNAFMLRNDQHFFYLDASLIRPFYLRFVYRRNNTF